MSHRHEESNAKRREANQRKRDEKIRTHLAVYGLDGVKHVILNVSEVEDISTPNVLPAISAALPLQPLTSVLSPDHFYGSNVRQKKRHAASHPDDKVSRHKVSESVSTNISFYAYLISHYLFRLCRPPKII